MQPPEMRSVHESTWTGADVRSYVGSDFSRIIVTSPAQSG
jgi:hypothetical protein